MVLWTECPVLMVEELFLQEGQRVEKKYRFQVNRDIKNKFLITF